MNKQSTGTAHMDNGASERIDKALPQHLEAAMNDGRSSLARAENAYRFLRLELLEGDLTPGEPLSVVALSRELKCSRVPVMEAIKRLAGEGFITIVPQVGCHVMTPAPADVRDFFVLFATIEATVTAFAAARRSDADAVEFEKTCARVAADAAKAGAPAARDPTYRRLNLLFHSHIHRMARSPASTEVARGLWDRSDFYIKLAFGSLYFSPRILAAQDEIRQAIVMADAERARVAVAGYLNGVGERVARQLERTAQD